MGTNALESYNLVESKGALLNIDDPRPDTKREWTNIDNKKYS